MTTFDELTEADLQAYYDAYVKAHQETNTACTGSQNQITAHQNALDSATNGVEAAITHFDGLVKHFQGVRDQWEDRKKVLARDFEKCKRAYWADKDAAKRANEDTPSKPR